MMNQKKMGCWLSIGPLARVDGAGIMPDSMNISFAGVPLKT